MKVASRASRRKRRAKPAKPMSLTLRTMLWAMNNSKDAGTTLLLSVGSTTSLVGAF